MLELAFESSELRSVCEDAAYAESRFGAIVAEALVSRLADIRAADHLLELPFVSVRQSDEQSQEKAVITLPMGRLLVIAVNHPKPPLAADGSLDWKRVIRVKILSVE